MSASDPRITADKGRFEDLAHALPDLVATTERQRHAERFHALRETETKGRPAISHAALLTRTGILGQ